MQTDRSALRFSFKNYVLLDSKSTVVHYFCKNYLMQNIWTQEEVMTLIGNREKITTNKMASIKNLDTKDQVWYQSEYITNILSLVETKEQYRIIYDTEVEHLLYIVLEVKLCIFIVWLTPYH